MSNIGIRRLPETCHQRLFFITVTKIMTIPRPLTYLAILAYHRTPADTPGHVSPCHAFCRCHVCSAHRRGPTPGTRPGSARKPVTMYAITMYARMMYWTNFTILNQYIWINVYFFTFLKNYFWIIKLIKQNIWWLQLMRVIMTELRGLVLKKRR